MDIRKVKKLIELLDESGIAEIEITEGEESVRISRYPSGAMIAQAPAAYAMAPAAPQAPAAAAAPAPAQPAEQAAAVPEEDGFLVSAPMVGTFYASSTPGAAPYVQVGDRVSEGDTLCIIEAMKLMNEIESEVDGRIVKILIENGQPVEYNQPLFLLEPV